MGKLAPESKIAEKQENIFSSLLDNEEEKVHVETDGQFTESKKRKSHFVHPSNEESAKCKWTLLFKRLHFFARYEHFVQIDVLSQEATEHNKWSKNVETKLQKLADAIYKHLSDNL